MPNKAYFQNQQQQKKLLNMAKSLNYSKKSNDIISTQKKMHSWKKKFFF